MKDSKVKRDFSTKVRQPFQDAIALIVHIIDYHNSFIESKFHRRQARVLKWYLLDLKEWIRKEEEIVNKTKKGEPSDNSNKTFNPLKYKEILIGHGLYKRIPIEGCPECADREADEILTGQTLSLQMQDELEPIWHSTQHDESDEIEAIKSEEMTEFEKAEYNKKLRKGKRSVWGEWNEAAEKQFFKGEKWEYKNGD